MGWSECVGRASVWSVEMSVYGEVVMSSGSGVSE